MSSPIPGPSRPARPSAAVYRRRRLVALLLLLLLVAGVVWGVTALLGRDEEGATAAAAAESGDTEPAAATDPAEEAPDGQVAACAAADVGADLALDPTGAGMAFEITVRNTGQTPCLVDAGPGTLVASVSSGSDDVWSSGHCAGDATNELLLDAGTDTAVTVRWDGHRSAEGCPGDQPQAGPGTYRVALELAGEPLDLREVFEIG